MTTSTIACTHVHTHKKKRHYQDYFDLCHLKIYSLVKKPPPPQLQEN